MFFQRSKRQIRSTWSKEGIFLFARDINSIPGGLVEELPPDHVSMMVAQLKKVAIWKGFRVCVELGLGQEESGAPARPHGDVAGGTAVPEPRSQRVTASPGFGSSY